MAHNTETGNDDVVLQSLNAFTVYSLLGIEHSGLTPKLQRTMQNTGTGIEMTPKMTMNMEMEFMWKG